MGKKQRTSQGQAAVELAIFGSLILLALSMLLVYGQNLDNRQQIKMQAFRKALQKAYYDNAAVSYTLKQDSRLVNLFSGYGQGQTGSASASATVMWQKGAAGSQGSDNEQNFSYYQINDNEIDLRRDIWEKEGRKEKTVISHTGEDQTIAVLPAVWKEEVVRDSTYNARAEKSEAGLSEEAKIRNKQVSDLQETITSDAYLRYDMNEYDARLSSDDPANQPEYVDAATVPRTVQGAYLNEINRIGYSEDRQGTTVHKERNWQTSTTE